MTDGLIKPHGSKIALLHRLLDSLVVFFTLFLSTEIVGHEYFGPEYVQAGIWAMLIFISFGGARQLYASWRVASLHQILGAITVNWLWTCILLVLLAFASKVSADYSRAVVFVWFALTPVFLGISWALMRLLASMLRASGMNTRTLAIVGRTRLGQQVVDKVMHSRWLGMSFIGYFDDREHDRKCRFGAADEQLAGGFADLVERAKAGEIDYVYITLPMKAEKRISALLEALSDTTASVYLVPNFFVFDLLHGKLGSLDGIPVVSLYESPFYGVDGWVKRLEDIVVASSILLLIAIPMLLIALGVKLTSPGPVLFRQRRYGLNGKIVEILKFRSMTVCEDGSEVVQATRGDARVTPLGKFLRRTSLDELPQFFNVLQGTMSVVGPRPHAVAHNEQYRKLIRGYMLRHKVKPGITGWAQINGWRGETDTLEKMEMRVKHDLAYVQNWSLWLDFKIIVLTIFRGFRNKNAY